jgi:hypothetical protein
MIINSSESRAVGFKLKEVIETVLPPELESELHEVASTREERDYEVLRGRVFRGLLCQWMMTLNSGQKKHTKYFAGRCRYNLFLDHW